MRVSNFSLLVVGGREISSGHVLMQHGSQYTLRLGNHGHRRCDAVVSIDGKDIGTYRICRDRFIVLERSQTDNGRFTFFSVNSAEASDSLAYMIPTDDRGLIQVRFRPEKHQLSSLIRRDVVVNLDVPTYDDVRPRDGRCWKNGPAENLSSTIRTKSMEAGITGLTGASDQQFVTVEDIEWRPEDEVVISVRLVGEARAIRPLQGLQANPVPRPV